MEAIVRADGRQLRLVEGQEFEMNRVAGEPGDRWTGSHDGAWAPKCLGAPLVAGPRKARITHAWRAPKLGHEYKNKVRYRRKFGHRQHVTARCRVDFEGLGEMAEKKGRFEFEDGRDSNSQRMGVQAFDGEVVKPGSIILRQRGTRFHPGLNVGLGRDYTIYSLIDGQVKFEPYAKGRRKKISVYSAAGQE